MDTFYSYMLLFVKFVKQICEPFPVERSLKVSARVHVILEAS